MRTAEFTSPKHPDKICDAISDTIVDILLIKDPYAKCSIHTMGGYGKIWITGEISSHINLSNDEVKEIVKNICGIEDVTIHISLNSKINIAESIKVDDQGIIIGYASDETPSMMPFEYELARSLNKYIYDYYPYDGKTQVTINGIDAVVVASFQNSKTSHLKELVTNFFKENSLSICRQDLNVATMYCNPKGEWNVGGLHNDVGISGTQSAIRNYGPRIPTGGGNDVGKDIYKIDRCGLYMARKIAVDYVKKYNLKYALVELSYGIDDNTPIQARVKGNDEGINLETGLKLYNVNGYDLSPNGIVTHLNLQTPQYFEVSQWGAFGNNFYWK
jgi:S-adenosylmethionine synthetase